MCDDFIAEIEAEWQTANADRLQDELGDMLFAMVNVVRLLGMDAEQTLSRANEKFERRFRAMEASLAAAGTPDLASLSLAELDAAWDAVTRHQAALESSDRLAAIRAEQARAWLWSEVQDSLVADLRQKLGASHRISELEKAVADGRVPATAAAEQLLDHYRKKQ